jgi:taurine dioxygenase
MSAKKVLRAIAPKDDGAQVMTSVATELDEHEMMTRGSFHPLVRTHPVTGEKGLYVDQTYAVGIEGLTHPESAALVSFLCDHITQPVFTCRLRWAPSTFVMWDNCTTLHHAFNDYDGFRREMYRTIVEGSVPR